jgi:hypothetical protein
MGLNPCMYGLHPFWLLVSLVPEGTFTGFDPCTSYIGTSMYLLSFNPRQSFHPNTHGERQTNYIKSIHLFVHHKSMLSKLDRRQHRRFPILLPSSNHGDGQTNIKSTADTNLPAVRHKSMRLRSASGSPWQSEVPVSTICTSYAIPTCQKCQFVDGQAQFIDGYKPIHKWENAHIWTGTSVTEMELSMNGYYQFMNRQVLFMYRIIY